MLSHRGNETVETERRKILVIGKSDCLNDALSGYAIQLAQRLKYDLFVVSVMPRSAGSASALSVSEAAHHRHALEILQNFKQKSARKNVHCDHAIQSGEIAAVADVVLHTVRRIEFVVTDSEYTKTQISDHTGLQFINKPASSGGKTYDQRNQAAAKY